MQVVKLAATEIKQNGLNQKSYQKFEQQIDTHQITSQIATTLALDWVDFLKSEGEFFSQKHKIFKSQIGLGSSDIVESIFGKFKVFIKGFKEIGKLVLTIPAFLGKITTDNIKQALESVHQRDIEDWIEESIGQSTLSKRRLAFTKTE
jgi:hypothetical protein